MYRYLIITLLILSAAKVSYSQKLDTTLLIANMSIQIEANDAIDYMYNFNFEKAEAEFKWFQYRFPWHPLPYFLLGLNEWWKIAPNTDEKKYDDTFLSYMDQSILKANAIYKKDPKNIEAAFFLAAAYGFKGRLYAERTDWAKAASVGKKALKYVRKSRGKEELSIEFLFGDGLYNYYTVWIPDNYKILKPIMSLFPKGDKQIGIDQLRKVSNNAFYTRIEARYHLMDILADEGKTEEALFLAKSLYIQYPNNPFFHRYYARLLYTRGRHHTAEKVCLDLLEKVQAESFGYEANAGRYAGFFLGNIYERKHEYDKAKKYYQIAIDYAEKAEAFKMGYYLYAMLYLGKIYEKEKNYALAKTYYKKVKKHGKNKHSATKKAKTYLKELRKKQRKD